MLALRYGRIDHMIIRATCGRWDALLMKWQVWNRPLGLKTWKDSTKRLLEAYILAYHQSIHLTWAMSSDACCRLYQIVDQQQRKCWRWALWSGSMVNQTRRKKEKSISWTLSKFQRIWRFSRGNCRNQNTRTRREIGGHDILGQCVTFNLKLSVTMAVRKC